MNMKRVEQLKKDCIRVRNRIAEGASYKVKYSDIDDIERLLFTVELQNEKIIRLENQQMRLIDQHEKVRTNYNHVKSLLEAEE